MKTEMREESTVTRDFQEGEGPGRCRLLSVATHPGETGSGVSPRPFRVVAKCKGAECRPETECQHSHPWPGEEEEEKEKKQLSGRLAQGIPRELLTCSRTPPPPAAASLTPYTQPQHPA